MKVLILAAFILAVLGAWTLKITVEEDDREQLD